MQFQHKGKRRKSLHPSKMDPAIWFWERATCSDKPICSESKWTALKHSLSLCLALQSWVDVLIQHQIYMFPKTFSSDSINTLNYAVMIMGVGKILPLPVWPYIHTPVMESKVNISCKYIFMLVLTDRREHNKNILQSYWRIWYKWKVLFHSLVDHLPSSKGYVLHKR